MIRERAAIGTDEFMTISLERMQRVLVIRRDNIGDLVCTTPMIQALKRQHPHLQVSVLANSYNGGVLENNPWVYKVYAYTKAKHRAEGQGRLSVYVQRFRLMRQLRRLKFDLAILATPSEDKNAWRLARQAGAQKVLGVSAGHLPLDIAVAPEAVSHGHQVERVYALLKPLGFEGSPPDLSVCASDDEAAWARSLLTHQGIRMNRPVIGLHISARKPCNRWTKERYVGLINQLHQQYGQPVVLFWAPGSSTDPHHPGDDELADAIREQAGSRRVIPFLTTTLRELVAGMSQLSTLVCSDGGAMHVASGVGCPVVCLFGYDGAEQWRPWGQHELLFAEPLELLDEALVLSAVNGFCDVGEASA